MNPIEQLLAWFLGLFSSKPGTTTPPPVDNTPAVPKITRLQPFRTTPVVSVDVFSKVLTDASSPMLAEAAAIRAAVRGNPLPLAQSFRESQYGKDASAQRNHNPLGLLWYDGSPVTKYESINVSPGVTIRLLTFPNWAAAFAEWQRRMDDPKYKGGVYMPQEMTTEDFIYTYVGGPGCRLDASRCGNGETQANIKSYLNDTVDRENRYYTLTAPSVPTDPGGGALTFGKVPLPAFSDKRIPDKKNRAWDLLGARKAQGVVLHRMLGGLNGTLTYFSTVPGGSAANCPAGPDTTYINGGCNGLTDWGVDNTNGDALMFNSPTGYPAVGVSANRAPWASGPYAGVPGDGKEYVDKFGINAINRDLASVEISGQYADPISEACKQKVVDIVAYHADQAKVPWDSFPMNPATGETFLFYHWEFCGKATKICPGPIVEAFLPDLIARVSARLKAYQTGAVS